MRARLAVAFVVVAFLVQLGSTTAQEDIVKTQTGYVRGLVMPTVRKFLGIPYAKPPVGDLRWAPSQPSTSWDGVYNATEWKAGCPQLCDLPPFCCPNITNEDCLFINVFTPRVSRLSKPVPVMVWIHGGRYEQAAATTLVFDGSPMVNASGLIIAAFNYRLGALGFAVSEGGLSGNFGFFDQRLAMKWVQDNIAGFGGDPNQITLFGQSAGGTSVLSHLVSAPSWPYFHRAIIQSAPMELPLKPRKDAIDLGNRLCKKLGCKGNDLTCLRSKPVQDILNAAAEVEKHLYLLKPIEVFFPWTPIVDGTNLSEQPLSAFRNGRYHQVPMMLGATLEEAWMFIFDAYSNSMSTTAYTALLFGIFHGAGVSVMKQYPPDWFGDKRPMLVNLANDYIFFCPNRNATINIAKSASSPMWTYVFNHSMSFDGWGPSFSFCQGHACHGVELPFLWNTGPALGYAYIPAEVAVSEQMGAYWTNFAWTADPNHGPSAVPAVWPQYSAQNGYSSLDFQPPNYYVLPDTLVSAKCNFWDSIGYSRGWNLFDPKMMQLNYDKIEEFIHDA